MASSDVNKPLLENAVAVLYKALVARGDKVVKMVQDIVSIYLLLAFDKSCLTQLQKLGKEKLSIFEKFIPADDRESLSSYQNLMSIVFPLPPAGTKANGGGAFKSIVGKVMSSGRNRAPSNTPQPLSGDNTKHVMLSCTCDESP